MEPYGGRFIVFKNIEWANHIRFKSFSETFTQCTSSPDWKLIKNSERYVEFEYLSAPIENSYSIVLFNDDGEVIHFFGKSHDDEVLNHLANFLNSILPKTS